MAMTCPKSPTKNPPYTSRGRCAPKINLEVPTNPEIIMRTTKINIKWMVYSVPAQTKDAAP